MIVPLKDLEAVPLKPVGEGVIFFLLCPAPFPFGEGYIASPLSVRKSVRPVRTYEKWFPFDIF